MVSRSLLRRRSENGNGIDDIEHQHGICWSNQINELYHLEGGDLRTHNQLFLSKARPVILTCPTIDSSLLFSHLCCFIVHNGQSLRHW